MFFSGMANLKIILVFYKETMVGLEAVWINQCSIPPQLVTNLLYITVCIITKSEPSNILVSHMEPRLVLRVYCMYSITYNARGVLV
jgi:hypothetical protein